MGSFEQRLQLIIRFKMSIQNIKEQIRICINASRHSWSRRGNLRQYLARRDAASKSTFRLGSKRSAWPTQSQNFINEPACQCTRIYWKYQAHALSGKKSNW